MMRRWFCFVSCYVKYWTRTSIQTYPYLHFFSYFYLLLSRDNGHQNWFKWEQDGALFQSCENFWLWVWINYETVHIVFWQSACSAARTLNEQAVFIKLERGIMDNVFLISDHLQSRTLSMLFFRHSCRFNPPVWWQSNQVLLTDFWVIEQQWLL